MFIVSCSMPDCDKPIHVKKHGLCKLHYGRWYQSEGRQVATARAERLFTRSAFSCATCGKHHPDVQVVGRSKRDRQYCDQKCLNAKYSRAARNSRLAERGSRFCLVCRQDISSRKLDAKFCSAFCSDVSRGARLPAPLPEIVCALEGCDVLFVPIRASTKCCSENHGKIQWNRASRADGRQLPGPWNDRRKANYHKRRAQKLGTQVEDIRPIDIFERDIWLCGLCSTPVDPDCAWPDPMSPSLDHVKPLSLGGTHTYENVQLAHLTCNVSKGNRVAA